MEDKRTIYSYLKGVRRKRLFLHAAYAVLSGFLVMLSVISIVSLLKKLFFLSIPYEKESYLLIFVFSFIIAFLTRLKNLASLLKNAIYIDLRFSLKDRFSSYIDGSKRGVPDEILSFQENSLTSEFLPKLKGRKVVDYKRHFSLKYILVLLLVIFGLSYVKDKKRGLIPLTDEEIKLIEVQEENIKNFIAYLNSGEMKDVLNKKDLKDFSDMYNEAAKKLIQSTMDRKEAIKVLSKLIDDSKELFKEGKKESRALEAVSDFDTGKLGADSASENFISEKQKELKDKMKKMSDKTKAKDVEGESEEVKKIMNAISDKLEEMTEKSSSSSAAESSDHLDSSEAKELKDTINKAHEEINKKQAKAMLKKKQEKLNKELKDTKSDLSGPPEEDSGPGYNKKEQDIHVTFNSRIDKIEKGKAGVDKGPGTTNLDTGYSVFDPAGPQDGQVVHDMTKEKFEKIYAGSRTETGKEIFVVKGALSEGESITVSSSKALPKRSEVNTPYNEVYAEYKEAAQKAVNVQKVPKVYKDYVLDYFDSINPDLK